MIKDTGLNFYNNTRTTTKKEAYTIVNNKMIFNLTAAKRTKVDLIKEEISATKLFELIDAIELSYTAHDAHPQNIFVQHFRDFFKDDITIAYIELIQALTNFVKTGENEYRILWNYDI